MSRETASCLVECREYGEKLLETMQRDQEEILRCLGGDLLKLYQKQAEEERRLAEGLVHDVKIMQNKTAYEQL